MIERMIQRLQTAGVKLMAANSTMVWGVDHGKADTMRSIVYSLKCAALVFGLVVCILALAVTSKIQSIWRKP